MSGSVDWEARYQAERTPWERPALNPCFLTWRSTGALQPCRILLPGAGRSGEPLALARDGFAVTVVDSAPTALAVQRARLETAGTGTIPIKAELIEADLLAWSPAAPFDAVYDQTCLCALPPDLWAGYAARLRDWLRPGGALFMLFMQTGQEGGPPYDCPIPAMRTLFGAGWQWPDTLPAAVAHNRLGAELPVILRKL